MKRSIYCIPLLLAAFGLQAQTTIDHISAGAGYAQSGYYSLSDGSSQQVPYNAWDLAFSNLDPLSAGVFINESTNSSNGQTGPALELYDAFTDNFDEVIDPGLFTEILYNPETTWAEGAFNTVRDISNPSDFGWGYYSEVQGKFIGNRVFVIKLRNGDFRKIIVDEYDGTSYKFRIANPDGSNPAQYVVNTNFNNGSPLIYFSLGPNGGNVTTPTNWDLVFCRYIDALSDGQGNIVQYNVTGILSGEGVLTARATGVDPVTVDYQQYLDSLYPEIGLIGHDWKSFNLQQGGWSTAPDRAYFVKTKDSKLYKLVFTAFAGSGTGTATVERTFIGQLSAAPELPTGISEVLNYPNPMADHLTLSFTALNAGSTVLRLSNAQGQNVWTGTLRTQEGLNVSEVDLPGLPDGQYFLSVQTAGGQFSRKITVAH